MRKRFGTQFILFCLCNVRCVIWCIVITTQELFLFQMWSFLPNFVNLSIQQCSIICSSNRPSFFKVVDEYYSMCIPKDTSHSFPNRLFRFRTLWCTFTRFNPQFSPLFTLFRGIVVDPCHKTDGINIIYLKKYNF